MATNVRTSGQSAVPWVQQTLTFARRTVVTQMKNRRAVVASFGFPVLYYVLDTRLFIQGTGSVVAVERAAMAVSFGMFGAFLIALVGFAQQLSGDLTQKRYRKFRSLPISPSADFAGRLLGGYVVSVVAYALLFAIGYLDGGAFDALGPISTVVVLGTLLAFCLVAMAVATLFAVVLRGDNAFQVSMFVLLVAYFVTGFNGLSVSILPDSLRGAMNYVPNSLATRIQFAYTVGHPSVFSPPALPNTAAFGALLVVYAVVSGAIATLLLRRFVYAGEVGE